MTYNQLLKKMQSNSLDKQTCIDYFNNLSKIRSHISFSSKMIINLFKYKHDYIFKYLFDNGIIYSSYFDDDTINKLSQTARKSESLVYAINFPSILICKEDENTENESFIYDKYTQQQQNILKYISRLYQNMRFFDFKTYHPYDIYFCFHYALEYKKSHFDIFKQKLNQNKYRIDSIKNYFFEFQHTFKKVPLPYFTYTLNFLHQNNILYFDYLECNFLSNKHYLNYFLNNQFSIKEFPSNFNESLLFLGAEKGVQVAKHIVNSLDVSFKYSISNSVSLIYFYVIESLLQKNGLFNFYINILLDLVMQHDTNFDCLCKEFNYCSEYNPLNLDILLMLSKNTEFKQRFDQQKKYLNIENQLISDYIQIQLNQECF